MNNTDMQFKLIKNIQMPNTVLKLHKVQSKLSDEEYFCTLGEEGQVKIFSNQFNIVWSSKKFPCKKVLYFLHLSIDNFDLTATKPGEIIVCHHKNVISKLTQVNNQTWHQEMRALDYLNMTSQIEYIQTDLSDFIVACCNDNQLVIMGIEKKILIKYQHHCEINYFTLNNLSSNFDIVFTDVQNSLNRSDLLSINTRPPIHEYFEAVTLLCYSDELYLVNKAKRLLKITPSNMKIIKQKPLNKAQHYSEMKVYKPFIFLGNREGQVWIIKSVTLEVSQIINLDILEIRSILYFNAQLLVSTESSRIHVLTLQNKRKKIKICY